MANARPGEEDASAGAEHDVWMRALVPAIETLNRTLVLIGEGGEERRGRSLGSAKCVKR